ncbi:MAG: hypothetical protein CMM98_03300 [Rickettsiales bacterium]|nr:hypothetical protein [Rickettsiales bacterium]
MSKLTDRQTEKYSRQIIIEKIGISGQKKIFNSSVCIVGCGGLGSSAAQYLSMTGIGNIMLIDDDLINLSNLNRQTLFFEKDIGQYKVDTLRRNLTEINPEAKIEVSKKKINKKNINSFLSAYKIILDCTDNFKSRYLINEYCFKKKKILVSAALQNFDIQASVFSSWRKGHYPCYNCIFPKVASSSNESCDDQGITAPVAGFGGVLQAMLTINLIISSSSKIFKELILFDSFERNYQKIKIKKNPKCNVCK